MKRSLGARAGSFLLLLRGAEASRSSSDDSAGHPQATHKEPQPVRQDEQEARKKKLGAFRSLPVFKASFLRPGGREKPAAAEGALKAQATVERRPSLPYESDDDGDDSYAEDYNHDSGRVNSRSRTRKARKPTTNGKRKEGRKDVRREAEGSGSGDRRAPKACGKELLDEEEESDEAQSSTSSESDEEETTEECVVVNSSDETDDGDDDSDADGSSDDEEERRASRRPSEAKEQDKSNRQRARERERMKVEEEKRRQKVEKRKLKKVEKQKKREGLEEMQRQIQKLREQFIVAVSQGASKIFNSMRSRSSLTFKPCVQSFLLSTHTHNGLRLCLQIRGGTWGGRLRHRRHPLPAGQLQRPGQPLLQVR